MPMKFLGGKKRRRKVLFVGDKAVSGGNGQAGSDDAVLEQQSGAVGQETIESDESR
jgi:hypothetical protein